jgi:hypothetical protein
MTGWICAFPGFRSETWGARQLGVMEIPEEAGVELRRDATQDKSKAWQELKSRA